MRAGDRAGIRDVQSRLNLPAARGVVANRLAFQMYAAERGLPTPGVLAVVGREAWGWCRHDDRPLPPGGWEAALVGMPAEVVVRPADGAAPAVVLRRRGDAWAEPGGTPLSAASAGARIQAAGGDTWLVEERVHDHPSLLLLGGARPHPVHLVALVDEAGDVGLHLAALRLVPGHGDLPALWAAVGADGAIGLALGGPDAPVTGGPAGGPAHVPEWGETRALAVRAAEAFLPLRSLALRIAVTARGPVLLSADPAWSPLPGQPPEDVAAALGIAPGGL